MSRQISLKLITFWLITVNLSYGTALALSNDSEQPIHIEADRGELDNRKQVAVYRGNVHLTQGTLRIDSDTLTIFYTPEKKLKKIIAEGQPAWYRQHPDDNSEDMRAKALRMEYHANNATIYLFQKAHVWQGANEFTGDRIEYDTEHRIVRGEGSKAGVGRVHVTIRPDDNTPPPNNSTPESSASALDSTLGSPPPASSPIRTPRDQVVDNQRLENGQAHGRTTTWLNLRTGPNTDHSKAALLPPRTQVAILGRHGEWLHIAALVKGESLEGWVQANFIRLSNPDGPGK
jgi:lipopolysaccharide export system protein LptA